MTDMKEEAIIPEVLPEGISKNLGSAREESKQIELAEETQDTSVSETVESEVEQNPHGEPAISESVVSPPPISEDSSATKTATSSSSLNPNEDPIDHDSKTRKKSSSPHTTVAPSEAMDIDPPAITADTPPEMPKYGAPTRRWLNSQVTPALLEGMRWLVQEK